MEHLSTFSAEIYYIMTTVESWIRRPEVRIPPDALVYIPHAGQTFEESVVSGRCCRYRIDA